MASIVPPLAVDFGAAKAKRVRELRSGGGPLAAEVEAAIEQVKRELGPVATDHEIVPVVLVYRKKTRKLKLPLPF